MRIFSKCSAVGWVPIEHINTKKHPNLSLKTYFKRENWEQFSKKSENFDKLINIHKYANELISIFGHIFEDQPLSFRLSPNLGR